MYFFFASGTSDMFVSYFFVGVLMTFFEYLSGVLVAGGLLSLCCWCHWLYFFYMNKKTIPFIFRFCYFVAATFCVETSLALSETVYLSCCRKKKRPGGIQVSGPN